MNTDKMPYEQPDFGVYWIDQPNQMVCTSCFAAGTEITMADGSTKNVEDIAEGDLVRTFDHETGKISSSEICLAWKSDEKKQPLYLLFENGKKVGIVGYHDFLLEDTRKYVRIGKDNVDEYIGKRFYNAENGTWSTLVSHETGPAVNFYCPYSSYHLNCIAEGMLTSPDDVDYLLNIYELDANLKANPEQLSADINQYGLVDVAKDYPEYAEHHSLMEQLQCKYFNIAQGKGLVNQDEIDSSKEYWNN